jgi:hypothetical protein
MFNWAKKALADVAGTQEPIYGPSAIKSVAVEAATTPYTEISSNDLKWQAIGGTSVETQTFYVMGEDGTVVLLQVIYSSISGIRTTAQFNSKIMYGDKTKPLLWCSTGLSDPEFTEDRTGFFAKDCILELSEDGNSYTIKSMNDERSIVNITIHRAAPGFQVGETGKTLFGTDLTNPWGSMRHAFWPRARAEGNIVTKDGTIDFTGCRAIYIYALQGMKPQHLAARWNFVTFHGPTLSAVMMEFTTPPSYGATVVNTSGIARDGEIVLANASGKTEHTEVTEDPEVNWPEPRACRWTWSGKTKDGKDVVAVLEGQLGERTDRVDVMAEVPGFVKQIVSTAAGTKPYIYMFNPPKHSFALKLKIGDDPEIVEEGNIFSEATFISDLE